MPRVSGSRSPPVNLWRISTILVMGLTEVRHTEARPKRCPTEPRRRAVVASEMTPRPSLPCSPERSRCSRAAHRGHPVVGRAAQLQPGAHGAGPRYPDRFRVLPSGASAARTRDADFRHHQMRRFRWRALQAGTRRPQPAEVRKCLPALADLPCVRATRPAGARDHRDADRGPVPDVFLCHLHGWRGFRTAGPLAKHHGLYQRQGSARERPGRDVAGTEFQSDCNARSVLEPNAGPGGSTTSWIAATPSVEGICLDPRPTEQIIPARRYRRRRS